MFGDRKLFRIAIWNMDGIVSQNMTIFRLLFLSLPLLNVKLG